MRTHQTRTNVPFLATLTLQLVGVIGFGWIAGCARGHEPGTTRQDAAGQFDGAAEVDMTVMRDIGTERSDLPEFDAAIDMGPADTGPVDPCASVVCSGDQICEAGMCAHPDSDGDGYRADDCNDSDPSIHPGGAEACDGVDRDCDGRVDEGACAPACSTENVSRGSTRCTGDFVAWHQFHFGRDDGSAANQRECQSQCTGWAEGRGLSDWCCELAEDGTSGRSWSCAVRRGRGTTGSSHPDSAGSYVGFGSCE